MELREQITDFWEEQHKNNHQPALSGCKYIETLNWLKLNDIIKPNLNILEVGVGLGYVTKELSAWLTRSYVFHVTKK